MMNRISPLLDEDEATAPTKPRSPAQQEASRKNGAKSSGPVTAAGKAISSRNSLKHALFARRIMPPADARGDHRAFIRLRAALAEEFQPRSASARFTMDLLARDLLQLTRVEQLIEAVMAPPAVTPEVHEKSLLAAESTRRLQLLRRLQAACEAGARFDCTAKQAKRLATELIALIESVKKDVAEADADEAVETEQQISPGPAEQPECFAKIDAEEQQELSERRALLQNVRTIEGTLRDSETSMTVLCGGRAHSKTQRAAWTALVAFAIWCEQVRLGGLGKAKAEFERADRANRLATANDPSRLMLLGKYSRQLEHSINRKYRALRDQR